MLVSAKAALALTLLAAAGLLSSLTTAQQRTCRRRAPLFTDCSTTTGECDLTFDANGVPKALPFPPPNTRTCYRTCHEDSGQCKSIPTVVKQQPLRFRSSGPNSKIFKISSPNFGKGDYRKSTNCRYHVKCDRGQIISYSVLDFDLETKDTCSSTSQCLDYVEITYPNLGTRKRFCGGGEQGQIHVDGSNALIFEFVSNRHLEKRGFHFFVNCIDPASDMNAIKTGAVDSPAGPPTASSIIGGASPTQCSEPPNAAPRLTPFEIPPPSAIFGFGVIPENPVRYEVSMTGSIFYQTGVIHVRNGNGVTRSINGVIHLEVANRFTVDAHRHYYETTGLTFNGYGTLEVNGVNAIFYQLGADPVLQPTPEEASTIIELERAISNAIGSDSFDVLDEFDIQPVQQQQFLQGTLSDALPPGLLIPRQAEPVAELANQYGNACNGVLRSTACAYQAYVLDIDCNTGLPLN